MLSMDKRRGFGLWFFVAIAAYAALYFNDVSYIFLGSDGDALSIFIMSGGGMAAAIMPFFAALPFATGFCADWNSGFAHPAAMRAGNGRYLRSKCLTSALSGGLATAMGTLIFVAILNLMFPTASIPESFTAIDPFLQVLRIGLPVGPILLYAGMIVMQFFAGACWALTGLAFSAFCPNVLLTLCVPLAAYRLSLEIYYWLQLPYWLNLPLLQDCQAELNYPMTLLTGALVFGGLSLILSAVFAIRAGRRLTYG